MAALPRLLLLGDSIRMSYQPQFTITTALLARVEGIAALRERIRRRLRERMASGLIEEVEGLLARGVPAERLQRLPPYLFAKINKVKYEKRVAGEFDKIEPLAQELALYGRVSADSRQLRPTAQRSEAAQLRFRPSR